MQFDHWQQQGEFIEVGGFQHHVYHSRNDKPHLLILHGYPTCCYDYHKALPWLERHFCVVMHDHLGFGLSDKPRDYSYSLLEQTDQALMLWRQLGIRQGVVLAHDYGTSLATELLARDQRLGLGHFKMQSLVLCNGSMHVELAQLRLIQKLLMNPWLGPLVARLSSKRTLSRNLKNLYHDASLVTAQEVDVLWQLMTHNQGRRVLSSTTGYIKQRYRYWHRWIVALQHTELPVHIVWAEQDPVAVKQMAEVLHQEIQNSTLIWLTDAGHFPMLECPKRWAEAVTESLIA